MHLYTEDNQESKEADSINNYVVDAELKDEDYKNVLFKRSFTRHVINRILSKDNNIGSYRMIEISLSFYDDQIYIFKYG